MVRNWKPVLISIRLMEEIAWKMGRKYVSENTGGGHPTEPRVPTGCPYKERCSRAKGK